MTQTAFGTELLAAAVEILAELGTSAVLRVVPRTHSPATGKVVDGAPVLHAVTASPPAPLMRRLAEGTGGSVVESTVSYLAADGLGFTPEHADRLTIGAKVWRVTKVDELWVDERVGAYALTVEV